MASQPERIAVLETKVDNLHLALTDMKQCNSREHALVMAKLTDLTDFKNKWVWLGGAGVALLSLVFGHLDTLLKLLH